MLEYLWKAAYVFNPEGSRESGDDIRKIVITRHGRPAGVIIGFESEDDWFDYRLEHHPEFLRRIAASRVALEQGRGIRLEELPDVGLSARWSRRRR